MHLPWRDRSPADGGPPISTSLTEAEAGELGRLAAGKRVLEIGSAYGYSTIVMALAGARVTAVDPHHWLDSRGIFLANVAAYYVEDLIDLRVGHSQDVLPVLAADDLDFDLVFIDGDHFELSVSVDVSLAKKVVAAGGTIACHDYGEDSCPGVRVALDRAFPDGPDHLVDTLFVVKP